MVRLKNSLVIMITFIILLLCVDIYAQKLPNKKFHIDWVNSKLNVFGNGKITPKKRGDFIEWQLGATIEAREDLIRNCVISMSELRVDAYNTAKDILRVDQDVSQNFYRYLKNVKNHRVKYRENDVIIDLEIPFFSDGGIANLFVKAGVDFGNFHKYDEYTYSTSFTGLVIDTRGQGKIPCLAPKIYDENHNTVYSIDVMEEKSFEKWGCVQYTTDPYYSIKYSERVGENPYRIAAIKNDKLIATDIAISNEDARVLLQNSETLNCLEEGKVIIIIDKIGE